MSAGIGVAVEIRAEAVSITDGTATFAGGGCGGRLGEATPESVVVRVSDLRRVVAESRCARLLLKLDIEGEEATLLPALLTILPRQCAIFYEWHQGIDGYRRVASLLSSHGFITSLARRAPCRRGHAVHRRLCPTHLSCRGYWCCRARFRRRVSPVRCCCIGCCWSIRRIGCMRWVSGPHPKSELLGCRYVDLPPARSARLNLTRFATLKRSLETMGVMGRIPARRVDAALNGFTPDVVVSVMERRDYVDAAYRLCRRRGLPLVLIVHDRLESFELVYPPCRAAQIAANARIYRFASARLCVSPEMVTSLAGVYRRTRFRDVSESF